ncbi:hypothetical protein Bbelb_097000 [Branchiostoma belcheri]|nr:hypothetical protein Bbelb_097000 [Branchiostoma belcheri]
MSGHVTNPSYFISFVKPAPAKLQTPGGTLWRLRTRVQRRPRVEASPRTRGISRLGRSVLPPRAERECDPAVALLHPLPPPDRVSRHPEDTDSSLGIQFRVAGTGHPAGSPGTERRDAVGRSFASVILRPYVCVCPPRNHVLSDNQRMGIGLVAEQPAAYFGERLVEVSDNLKGGWRRRADFGSLLIVFGHWATTDSRRRGTTIDSGRRDGLPPPYSFGWWPGKRARAPPDLNLLKFGKQAQVALDPLKLWEERVSATSGCLGLLSVFALRDT